MNTEILFKNLRKFQIEEIADEYQIKQKDGFFDDVFIRRATSTIQTREDFDRFKERVIKNNTPKNGELSRSSYKLFLNLFAEDASLDPTHKLSCKRIIERNSLSCASYRDKVFKPKVERMSKLISSYSVAIQDYEVNFKLYKNSFHLNKVLKDEDLKIDLSQILENEEYASYALTILFTRFYKEIIQTCQKCVKNQISYQTCRFTDNKENDLYINFWGDEFSIVLARDEELMYATKNVLTHKYYAFT
jgi:hypothetical protein